MRRRRPDAAHGLVVVSDDTVTGVIDEPSGLRNIDRLVSVGLPTHEWLHERRAKATAEDDDRQLLAIGAAAQARLTTATIAVIGNSGGGSHVTQQLIHAGVGTLIVIDPDVVTATNLRRLVGAVAADSDETKKVEIARRTAAAVRSAVEVNAFTEPFPSTATLAALRTADIVIGCVDGWDSRDALNTFALASRIAYIDIGLAVAPPVDGLGMRVGGQVAVVLPGGPCLRCMGLVTDAKVTASRERRQGYADDTPEPQVVSLNGTLASEAVTAALMMLAEDDRVVPYRRYAYPPGKLVEVGARWRADCPACRGAHLEHRDDTDPAESQQRVTASRFKRWLRNLATRG
jgi:molybdopterin/thiamine biosynthesis adenylyltransferase